MVLTDSGTRADAVLAEPASEKSDRYVVDDPATGQRVAYDRQHVINPADRPVNVKLVDGTERLLVGFDLGRDLSNVEIHGVFLEDPQTQATAWHNVARVQGGRKHVQTLLRVPRPRVQAGIVPLVKRANPALLWGAIFVFPICFLITSVRWHALLKALDIHLTQMRTFVLTMVGSFYSSFMPGSTGGDVLKAYYAAKQTPHHTQAVLSVLIDRVIGMLALVILGGVMAAIQYYRHSNGMDPGTLACRRVALGAAAILLATMFFGILFLVTPIRRALGLDYLINRLPMQKHVQHGIQAMRSYRGKPMLMFLSLVGTFPVHIVIVLSAMFAGMAFGIEMPTAYYFVAIPVIALAGALPLAPQGAGVMEFFAIQLTKQHGVPVSQAFALTMSMRLVQVLWNLTGGIFVLRGGYHAPTAKEAEEMEHDEEATVGGRR